jgi:dTDP-4-amino-4,6-dideoxygalactose transaminase
MTRGRKEEIENIIILWTSLYAHEQPVFHSMSLFNNEKYPVAEYIARQGLYLPSGLTLTESQIDQVSKIVHESLKG